MLKSFIPVCAGLMLFAGTATAQVATPEVSSDFVNIVVGGGPTLGIDAYSRISGTLQAGLVYYTTLSDEYLLGLGATYRLTSRGYNAYLTTDAGFGSFAAQRTFGADDITLLSFPLTIHKRLQPELNWTIYAGPSVDMTLFYNGGDYENNYTPLNISMEGGIAYLGHVFVVDGGISFPLTNGFRATSDNTRTTPFAVRALVGWRLFTL